MGRNELLRSKKGFYIISPFLGFFFFLITVSTASIFLAENNQQIETARGGESQSVIFISHAIQADAVEVFLQNYLQHELDTYEVSADSEALTTLLEKKVGLAVSGEMQATYLGIYANAFSTNCSTAEKAWSFFHLKFNGYGIEVFGTNKEFNVNPYTGIGQLTAVRPYLSQYGLRCLKIEPPINATIDLRVERPILLDANCICCQTNGFGACYDCRSGTCTSLTDTAINIKNCQYCLGYVPPT